MSTISSFIGTGGTSGAIGQAGLARAAQALGISESEARSRALAEGLSLGSAASTPAASRTASSSSATSRPVPAWPTATGGSSSSPSISSFIGSSGTSGAIGQAGLARAAQALGITEAEARARATAEGLSLGSAAAAAAGGTAVPGRSSNGNAFLANYVPPSWVEGTGASYEKLLDDVMVYSDDVWREMGWNPQPTAAIQPYLGQNGQSTVVGLAAVQAMKDAGMSEREIVEQTARSQMQLGPAALVEVFDNLGFSETNERNYRESDWNTDEALASLWYPGTNPADALYNISFVPLVTDENQNPTGYQGRAMNWIVPVDKRFDWTQRDQLRDAGALRERYEYKQNNPNWMYEEDPTEEQLGPNSIADNAYERWQRQSYGAPDSDWDNYGNNVTREQFLINNGWSPQAARNQLAGVPYNPGATRPPSTTPDDTTPPDSDEPDTLPIDDSDESRSRRSAANQFLMDYSGLTSTKTNTEPTTTTPSTTGSGRRRQTSSYQNPLESVTRAQQNYDQMLGF